MGGHIHDYILTEIADKSGGDHNIQGTKKRHRTEEYSYVARTSTDQLRIPQEIENTPTSEEVYQIMITQAQEIKVVKGQMSDISAKLDTLLPYSGLICTADLDTNRNISEQIKKYEVKYNNLEKPQRNINRIELTDTNNKLDIMNSKCKEYSEQNKRPARRSERINKSSYLIKN
jgi:hypothetical protein